MNYSIRTRVLRPARREEGSALVTSLAFTLVVSMLVGGVLNYAMARRGYVEAKKNSEAALLLAESGVNDEFAYIYRHSRGISNTTTPYGGAPTIATGEPYKGRKGTVDGVNGNYWVFTCAAASDGTPALDTAWNGKGPFWVIANATVNKAWRQIRIKSAVGGGGSPLELYAVFGVNAADTGGNQAITLSNAQAIIEGTVGTNGKVSNNTSPDLTGNNWLLWTQAQNCNTANSQVVGSQFTNTDQVNASKPLYTMASFKTFPTITKLAKDYFLVADPWAYLAANNDNDKIRTFKTLAPALSNAGTQLLGATKSQSILSNTDTVGGNTLIEGASADKSSFTSVPAYTGTTITLGLQTPANKIIDDIFLNDKVLIFPPGDYYFTEIQLSYIAGQKIVIDDDWLTSADSTKIGNPDQKQIRFWIADGGNQNDFVEVPISFTSTGGGDASIFRFLYNKTGKQFTFHRVSTFGDTNGNLTVYGAAYCVTGDPSKPTNIKFWGESANSTLPIADRPYVELRGALIADKVEFQGYGKIVFSTALYNPNDILQGLEDWGGYQDGS